MAGHLHQSDLLVLDYELNRDRRNDGTIAINILRRIASNGHFNLVVIYTSMELETVFEEVRIGLITRCLHLATAMEEVKTSAQEQLERAEEFWSGAEDELLNSIGKEAYLSYRQAPAEFWNKLERAEQPVTAFHDLCTRAGFDSECRRAVLIYALGMREEKLENELSSVHMGMLTWPDTDPYWIQSDSVFVAFARKEEHDQLMDRLGKTLSAWSPPPSRLFLSRLRAEIDEQGFAAQESVLGRRRALAYWYSRVLNADRELRLQYVADSMRGHADLLLEEVLPKVSAFAHEMVEFEKSSGKEDKEICDARFKVDLSDASERHEALIEHNALVCSRPTGGRHLTTGHVFRKGEEHWICLSPACDMVPGQGSSIRKDHFGDWIPFVAVLLHPGEEASSSKGKARLEGAIKEGRYIFLDCGENGYQGFLFTMRTNSEPVWHVVYAKAGGMFRCVETKERVVTVCWTKRYEGDLVAEQSDVEVVGQLRYEYALNLLNRLGGSFSRVGLDFVGKIV